MDQRVGPAVPAAFAAEVRQYGPALRQGELVGRGDAFLELVAGVERGRRRDHLEGGTGWIGFLGRAVEQWLVRVGVERLGGLAGRGLVVAGQRCRVVGGAGHHRKDFAGLRVERHDRPLTVAERGGRDLLDPGYQRGDDTPTPLLASGHQVGNLGDEQALVLAGEEVVLGPLQARGGVQTVVAGDGGVQLRGRILPLVLVLVVGRYRACDRLPAGHGDPTPLPFEPLGDLAGVVRLVTQSVGLLGL